ncbi:MAG TPA: AAA family ATPase [Amycolatopsis sp.]|nr:AAA family ATPase [Amycolatopsis sp.]
MVARKREPLLGRGLVSAALHRAIDAAVAGQGGLILLAGEPGIGKTAVAAEAAAYARESGVDTAWGACADSAPGFWPWREILRQATGEPEPLDAPEPAGNAVDARLRLFDGVADALLARPLVAILDDLHWADAGSIRLLEFIARRARHGPLLIVGTYRDVEITPGHPLREVLAHAETIPLTGLPQADVAALLATLGRPVDQAQAGVVHRRTAGNPFFVQQVARLPDAGNGTGVPVAVREVLLRRFARLPNETATRLGMAAVVGAEFGVAALGDPVEVLAALEPAVRARIVAPGEPGAFRFVHDLFRERLYENLAAAQRRRLHLAVAATLVSPRPGELARHYVAALPLGDPAVAMDWCGRAARESERLLAYEDAARHLRTAARIGERFGHAWPGLRIELAEAELRAGNPAAARELFAEVAGRPDCDARTLAEAALGQHRAGIRTDDSRREVVALLERALAGTEPGLRARLLAAQARELADGQDSDVPRARQLAAHAVATAERAGDQAALALALFAEHDVVWAPGTAARRVGIADRMAIAARSGGAPDLEFEARFCRFVALVELADPRAQEALWEAGQVAERWRLPRPQYLVRSRQAAMKLVSGQLAEGERLAREAAAFADRIGEPDGWGVLSTQLITLAMTRSGPAGIAEELREHAESSLPPEFAPYWRCFTALAAGDESMAAAILRGLRPAEEVTHFRWRALAGALFDVEIAVAAGADDVCRDRYRYLAPFAEDVVVVGGVVAVVGLVALCLGLCATVAGDHEHAVAHFEDALARAERLGARPLATRARVELGAAMLVRGDRERGRALLAGAAEVADELGLDWVRDRALAVLAGPVRNTFRQDGEVWTVSFAGRTATLRDAKGLHDIAALLRSPGRDVSATTLLPAEPETGSDEVLDERARREYRQRLSVLDDEIAEAEADHDMERVARGVAERDALITELTRAYGLHGRVRRLGDPGERARTTVTARIRDAVRRVERQHPELGAHLRATVKTGRLCGYRPDEPVRWEL